MAKSVLFIILGGQTRTFEELLNQQLQTEVSWGKNVPIVNKVVLVQVSSCCNIGSIRDDSYWGSWKNSLVLIELHTNNACSCQLPL